MSLAERARLTVTAAAVGTVFGIVATGVLITLVTTSERALELSFGAGAFALGFGLLGWSGSIIAGEGIEQMQTYLETGSDWTERKSRRAMARISGFGCGLMIGATAVELLLGAI